MFLSHLSSLVYSALNFYLFDLVSAFGKSYWPLVSSRSLEERSSRRNPEEMLCVEVGILFSTSLTLGVRSYVAGYPRHQKMFTLGLVILTREQLSCSYLRAALFHQNQCRD